MDYVAVHIPKPMADSIRKIMGVLGYRSVAEFVIEAIRERVHMKEIEYDIRIDELAKEKNKTIGEF